MAFRISGGKYYDPLTRASLVRGVSSVVSRPNAAQLRYSQAASGQLGFVTPSYGGFEGTVLEFGVIRTLGASGTVAVDWSITGLSEGAPTPSNGTISWNTAEAGEKRVSVILGQVTAGRTGNIVLSNPRSLSGGVAPTILVPTASLTIVNDAVAPSAPVLGTPTVQSASQVTVPLTTASTDVGGSGVVAHFLEQAQGAGSTSFSILDALGSAFPRVVTGLSASTVYRYRARGRDAGGNYSAYSAVVDVLTDAVSGFVYDSLLGPVTHYVSSGQIGTGHAGTLADPFSMQDALAFNPGGQRARLQFAPGDYVIYGTSAFGGPIKAGFFRPQYGGTAGAPLIWSAQYACTRSTTLENQKTRFMRPTDGSQGYGAIFGVGTRDTSLTTDVWIDGIECPTSGLPTFDIDPNQTGGPYGEIYQFAWWNVARCKATRLILDGANVGMSSGSTNIGGIWAQQTADCEIADVVIRNQGSGSGRQVFAGVEMYGATRMNIHHCSIDRVHGQGIYIKGEDSLKSWNRGNRIHHNLITRCYRGLFQYMHGAGPDQWGTSLDDASWWYQNIVVDGTIGFYTNSLSAVRGLIVANNVFARNTQCDFYLNNTSFSPLQFVMNNIFLSGTAFEAETGMAWSPYGSNFRFDRNLYYGNNRVAWVDGGNRDLAYFRTLIGYLGVANEASGAFQSNPQFVNSSGNDFRLGAGSPARDMCVDFLNLRGLGTSGAINAGPFINPDMSDAIGVRLAA